MKEVILFFLLSLSVTLDNLKQLLQQAFPEASITLSGDLYHVQVQIVCPSFEGLPRLKRDKQVYGHLHPLILSGELHAVSLKTLAPSALDGTL